MPSTEPDGEYDVILELVGGDCCRRDVEQLAPHGRLVVIGTGAGARPQVDFGLLMRKRVRLLGSTLRARSAEEKALVVARLGEDALPLLAAGRLAVHVQRRSRSSRRRPPTRPLPRAASSASSCSSPLTYRYARAEQTAGNSLVSWIPTP